LDPKPSRPSYKNFFDLELDPKRAELTRPASLMRTTEWGGLAVLSLIASLTFPPYFVTVLLWVAGLNAGGLLWVSHLGEAGRRRLREFEREFAEGHAMEEAGHYGEAVAFYKALAPRYADFPKIADIAVRRAEKVLKEHPPHGPGHAKPAAKPKRKGAPKAAAKAAPKPKAKA
jgi:hypothetical protein